MISARTSGHGAIRRWASSALLIVSCMLLPVGCGEPGAQQSTIPPDFGEKLEKEHPELFIKKTGNKTEVLAGRDKKDIIRREWLKAQQGNP
jgi:hypothetical protein